LPINLYYWRDKTGHEIDVIVDNGDELIPIEIKSGKTLNSEFFKNMDYWRKLSKYKMYVLLYGGEQNQKRSDGNQVFNWRKISGLDL